LNHCRKVRNNKKDKKTMGKAVKKSIAKETRKIVRTYSAGVFFGNVESRNGQEVVMTSARRIWYWAGAASLSELAQRGTSNPTACKFPVAMDRVILTQAIEIIDVTPEAAASIDGVAVWTR
jgi:hypothetical protein